jgi:hypothetical protein
LHPAAKWRSRTKAKRVGSSATRRRSDAWANRSPQARPIRIDCEPFRVRAIQSPGRGSWGEKRPWPMTKKGSSRRRPLRHRAWLPSRPTTAAVAALDEQIAAPDRWLRALAGADNKTRRGDRHSRCRLGSRDGTSRASSPPARLICPKMVASTELSRQECRGRRGRVCAEDRQKGWRGG